MQEQLDNLMFSAASFEDRCLAAPWLLYKEGYRTQDAIMFCYEHPDLRELRERRVNRLQEILRAVTRNHVEVISCDLYHPEVSFQRLCASTRFAELCCSATQCTVDTSTFTKMHLLMLLRILDRYECLPRRLLYTRTRHPIFSKLTEGILGVATIPGYAGNISPRRHTKLLMFLGFEAERAMAIWRTFEPSETVAVMSVLSQVPQWEKRMMEVHRFLLSMPGVRVEVVAADSPGATARLIRSERTESQDRFDLCIVPLGTKAEVIGIYEAVRKMPEVQLAYCPPLSYLPNYPRRGVGKTVIYDMVGLEGGDVSYVRGRDIEAAASSELLGE
jgi:hypothetical protein